MSLNDGAIDACGEAKVIGVDDQTAHGVSLAGLGSCSRIVVRRIIVREICEIESAHRIWAAWLSFVLGPSQN